MSLNEEPKDWEPIGKALSNLPVPPPNERFVQGVMSRIRAEESQGTRWIDLWKIPALGFGLAAALLAIMVTFWRPADFQDPLIAQWVESETSGGPDRDEVLRFALDESEGELGGDL